MKAREKGGGRKAEGERRRRKSGEKRRRENGGEKTAEGQRGSQRPTLEVHMCVPPLSPPKSISGPAPSSRAFEKEEG